VSVSVLFNFVVFDFLCLRSHLIRHLSTFCTASFFSPAHSTLGVQSPLLKSHSQASNLPLSNLTLNCFCRSHSFSPCRSDTGRYQYSHQSKTDVRVSHTNISFLATLYSCLVATRFASCQSMLDVTCSTASLLFYTAQNRLGLLV